MAVKIKKIDGIIRRSSFLSDCCRCLGLVMMLCCISEYMRLMIVASAVWDAVQSAIISTANGNYDDAYHSVRESYAGCYQPVGSFWEGSVDNTLGLQKSGGHHVKYARSGGIQVSVRSVDIRNAPLAPSDPAGSQALLPRW